MGRIGAARLLGGALELYRDALVNGVDLRLVVGQEPGGGDVPLPLAVVDDPVVVIEQAPALPRRLAGVVHQDGHDGDLEGALHEPGGGRLGPGAPQPSQDPLRPIPVVAPALPGQPARIVQGAGHVQGQEEGVAVIAGGEVVVVALGPGGGHQEQVGVGLVGMQQECLDGIEDLAAIGRTGDLVQTV